MGHAPSQKWVFDQHWGLPIAKRFYHNRPPSILDAPLRITADALDLPDPENPIGAKGIGEPAIGCGAPAVLCAVADAVGDEFFKRLPITPDMILSALESGPQSIEPLTAHV